MSTMGRPSSYFPDLCTPAHNECLLGATGYKLASPLGGEFTLSEVEGRSARDDGNGYRELRELRKSRTCPAQPTRSARVIQNTSP
jgi:hypothetical protein